jgi:hypothetical protein
VPPAQLPANPENFLPISGGTMEGNINVDGYDLLNANTIQGAQVVINQIDSLSGKVQVQVPLVMNNNKIEGAAKGTANGDVVTVENINDHNTSPFAHADIRNLISAIQGAYIYRGVINENTINVTQINLNERILVLMGRAAILGDVLTDLDRTDWYYDGTSWDNMGQTFVVLASAVNDGLMSKEDFTKLSDLYTKAQIDSTFVPKTDIINDLTTGGATKVLSAEQGKTLKTQVDTKANITQEAWITPTLISGWVNVGGIYTTCQYMKDQFGFVHLKGRISSGTFAAPLFTLPIGYRPSKIMNFAVPSAGEFGQLTVQDNGVVIPQVGKNSSFHLDGITFRGEL